MCLFSKNLLFNFFACLKRYNILRIFDVSKCLRRMFLIFRQKSNTIYKLIFRRLLENFYRLNGFYLSDTKTRVSLLRFSVPQIKVQAAPFKHFIFGSNLVDCHHAFQYYFVLVPYTFPNIKSRPQCIGRIVFFFKLHYDFLWDLWTFYCSNAGRRRGTSSKK